MDLSHCQLIAVITASTAEGMARDARRAFEGGADLIELRLDYLDHVAEQDLSSLVRGLSDHCIVTLRPTDEGGRFDGSEADRFALLIHAEEGKPAFTDVEFSHIRRSSNIRQKAGLAAGRMGLILSAHDFKGRPPKLHRLVQDMIADPDCDVAKVVWAARDATDNFEAFDLLRSVGKPMIALCMGDAGLASRVLARKLGAFGTYCSLDESGVSAPGQPTLSKIRHLYRWDRIDAETHVFGVVGHPVGHSMSPAIFNAAFEFTGLNAVYLPWPVRPGEDHFREFTRQALDRPWLDIRGISVTLPHKEHAYRLCRDALDPMSQNCGAVNTLTFVDGKIAGSNTDAPAALDALVAGMGCMRDELRGRSVSVLGAGGVARAVLAGLSSAGAEVTLFNRTAERASKLASDFSCRAQPWDQRSRTQSEILINCTSIGMSPNNRESPFAASSLSPEAVVFDTVYNPVQTQLLTDATERGCRTISGVDMFVRQAVAQFETWTGLGAPGELMESVVRSRLSVTDQDAKIRD